MGSVLVVVVALLVVCGIIYRLRTHGEGIIARRGMSIGADLGTLRDTPRMLVHAVTRVGSGRVRVILTPETSANDGTGRPASSDLDVVVSLGEEEFGYELLYEWQRSETPVAVVTPPGGRLVRLRSTSDLQHLTLRRADNKPR